MSHFASVPHSLPKRHRVNSEYKKRLRSLREISGECRTWPANEDAAVLLRELPVSQERGVTRPLTHDSVCLVSDTERQPAGDVGREERAEKSEAETRVAGWEKECWLGDRSGHRDRDRKQKVDTGRGRCWKELVVTGRLKHPAGALTHDQPRLHPSQVEVRHLLK